MSGTAVIQKFALGRIVATPGALKAFEDAGESPLPYLSRHSKGDWGDLYDEDKYENDMSVTHDLRILSAYKLTNGTKIWIITEADRSSTCALLTS